MKILTKGQINSCKVLNTYRDIMYKKVSNRNMMSILCKLMQLEAFPHSIHVSCWQVAGAESRKCLVPHAIDR